MAWDPSRQRVVMFGGAYYDQATNTSVHHEDFWEWDGEGLKPSSPAPKGSE